MNDGKHYCNHNYFLEKDFYEYDYAIQQFETEDEKDLRIIERQKDAFEKYIYPKIFERNIAIPVAKSANTIIINNNTENKYLIYGDEFMIPTRKRAKYELEEANKLNQGLWNDYSIR